MSNHSEIHSGKIVNRDQDILWVEFPVVNCHGCHKHCQSETQLIRLPEQADISDSADQVEVSMNGASQLLLLLNSLMFPLIGFLLGATLANQLGFRDLMSVLLSLLGMALGILVCKQFSLQRLNIKEVTRC